MRPHPLAKTAVSGIMAGFHGEVFMRPHRFAAALVLLAALPAAAETYQFSNSIFELPPGWDHLRAEADYQILSPGDDQPCDYCYFYIARSQPSLGDLASFVTRSQRIFVEPEDQDSITPVSQVEIAHERGHPIAMQMFKVDGEPLMLAGFQIRDRYELIGLQGRSMDEEDLQEMLTTFQQILPRYLETTRYVSIGAAPLMPPPEPGPLNGVWFGTWLDQSIGLDMMMRMDLRSSLYVFWPEGYFHDGTPPDGLIPPDPQSLREPTISEFGTYRVVGSEVRLSYANGETDTLTMEEGEGLNDGRTTTFPVAPLADDSRIEGTISSSYASGFGAPGMMSQGGVSSSSFTTFHKDGTYGGESSSSAYGSFGDGMGGITGGYGTGSEKGHSGRYRIQDGMIHRQSADGRQREDPELIFDLDGQIYIGQQALEAE